MSININNNSGIVNNKQSDIAKEQENKFYYSVYSETFEELFKLDQTFNTILLYHYFLSKNTYKNGLVGIFSHLTEHSLSVKFKVHKNTIKRHIIKMEKSGLLKIINQSPMIIQLLKIPTATIKFKDLEHVLKYVSINESEFKFDTPMMLKRANEFYLEFSKEYKSISKKQYESKFKLVPNISQLEDDKDNPFL